MSFRFLKLSAAAFICAVFGQQAQAQAQTPQAGTAAQAAQPAITWTTQCVAAERTKPLNCSMEQRVILRETGQQLVKLAVRVGPDQSGKLGQPALLVQLPLGLSIRGGLALKIDEGSPTKLDIQTCEASGCYAGSPVSDALLDGMKKGKQINIVFQNLKQEEITIPVTLSGFSAAYEKIR